MSHASGSSHSGGSRKHTEVLQGDEFAYQTRMVVYNFLGLVPSTPSRGGDEDRRMTPDELVGSQHSDIGAHSSGGGGGDFHTKLLPWSEDLNTLPSVTLFDRLGDSERLLEISSAMRRELQEKVGAREPTSHPDGHQSAHNMSSSEQTESDEAHRMLVSEMKNRTRGQIDEDMHAVTIIQKKNKVKCLSELTGCEIDSGGRRSVLYPVPELLQVPSSCYTGQSDSATTSQAYVKKAKPGPPSYSRSQSSSSSVIRSPNSSSSSSEIVLAGTGMGSGPAAFMLSNGNTLNEVQADGELTRIKHRSPEPGKIDSGEAAQRAGVERMSSREANVSHGTTDNGWDDSESDAGMNVDRQTSSVSGGGASRRSTYVDIQDVDDIEKLIASKALPPMSLPLKREISRAVAELDEKYGIDDADGLPPHTVTTMSTPESDVADSLRVIGDRVQEEYGEQLDEIINELMQGMPRRAITYENIQSTSLRLLQHTHHGWTKVALMMVLGQRLVTGLLKQGYSGVGQVAEYTALMIENHTADFIINNGGWQSITELGVAETPLSLHSDVRLPLITSLTNEETPPSLDAVDASTSNSLDSQSSRSHLTNSSDQLTNSGSQLTNSISPSTDHTQTVNSSGKTDIEKRKVAVRVERAANEEICVLRESSDGGMVEGRLSGGGMSLDAGEVGVIVGVGVLVALSAYLIYRRQRSM